MGYFSVPLLPLQTTGSCEGWYSLVPKPLNAFTELVGVSSSERKKTKKITAEGSVDLVSIKEFVKLCQTDGSGKYIYPLDDFMNILERRIHSPKK